MTRARVWALIVVLGVGAAVMLVRMYAAAAAAGWQWVLAVTVGLVVGLWRVHRLTGRPQR